jgi:hypothetical protein
MEDPTFMNPMNSFWNSASSSPYTFSTFLNISACVPQQCPAKNHWGLANQKTSTGVIFARLFPREFTRQKMHEHGTGEHKSVDPLKA